MPRYFLTGLNIEGFRGINNHGKPLKLTFDPTSVNSVFAGNAMGKSSIFEALCFAIKGHIPRMAEDFQPQERSRDYLCNHFHPGSAVIELTIISDDPAPQSHCIRVELDKAGKRTITCATHPSPNALLEFLNEEFVLLDYRTFQRFVDALPGPRGKSFSALVGLEKYSRLRQSLEAAKETRSFNTDFGIGPLETEIKNDKGRLQQAQDSMKFAYGHVCGTDEANPKKAEDAALRIVAELQKLPVVASHVGGKGWEAIDFGAIKASLKAHEGSGKKERLDRILVELAALEALAAPEGVAFDECKTALTTLIEARDAAWNDTRGPEVEALFRSAKALLDGGTWDEPQTCPLCGETAPKPLHDLVATQLAAFEKAAARSAELAAHWPNDPLAKALESFEKSPLLHGPKDPSLVKKIAASADKGSLTAADLEAVCDAVSKYDAARMAKIAALELEKAQISAELPASVVETIEKVEFGRQFVEALKGAKLVLQQAKAKEARLKVYKRWHGFIDRVRADCARAEETLSRSRLTAVGPDYKARFARLVGNSQVTPLLTRTAGRPDINLQLEAFHSASNVSAKAVLSESYRNALAISVFLSSAAKYAGNAGFVVLDDVTSSFDAGNQWLLMTEIIGHLQHKDAKAGLQYIILSHDGLLEKHFDKQGSDPNVNWKSQKLSGLAPMGEISASGQNADHIKQRALSFIASGNTEIGQTFVRQYLEMRLLQIIDRVNIPVPLDFSISNSQQMVGNALKAIERAVALQEKASPIALSAAQLNALKGIHMPALVANWVSHYSSGVLVALNGGVLQSVLQAIDDFADCFRWTDSTTNPPTSRWYKSLASQT